MQCQDNKNVNRQIANRIANKQQANGKRIADKLHMGIAEQNNSSQFVTQKFPECLNLRLTGPEYPTLVMSINEQNTKCKKQSTKYKIQNAKYNCIHIQWEIEAKQNTKYKIQLYIYIFNGR